MDFSINCFWEQEQNISALLESHVKSSPLKGYEIRELTATQQSTLLFQLALLLPCCSATILSHPSLLLLIVNDFFKCEPVSLTRSPRRCHIPRCKSRVNPQIRFWLPGCVDIVRMGERARNVRVRRLPRNPKSQTTHFWNDFDNVVLNHLKVSRGACETHMATEQCVDWC